MLKAFLAGSVFFSAVVATAAAGSSGISAKIEKAREMILKNDRAGAVKALKDLYRETAKDTGATSAAMGKPKPGARDTNREVAQAWREVSEVFLTDKGQNQFSFAESLWLTKPKDAIETLLPLLKLEDGNLAVARLGSRAALRTLDCGKADTFLQQAELTFPIGADVKLLRLQVQECLNGTNASAPALKVPSDVDWAELDGALRMLLVKEAIRRKDLKSAQAALVAWETSPPAAASEDPEFWYWKWRASPELQKDRSAARKYLRACTEMTPRRRKNFVMHPEFCLHTETVESDLKSSDKSGL